MLKKIVWKKNISNRKGDKWIGKDYKYPKAKFYLEHGSKIVTLHDTDREINLMIR